MPRFATQPFPQDYPPVAAGALVMMSLERGDGAARPRSSWPSSWSGSARSSSRCSAIYLTARRILAPLDEIEVGVNEIINGNVERTFRPVGSDLDGLANALNVMLARLLGRPEPGDEEYDEEGNVVRPSGAGGRHRGAVGQGRRGGGAGRRAGGRLPAPAVRRVRRRAQRHRRGLATASPSTASWPSCTERGASCAPSTSAARCASGSSPRTARSRSSRSRSLSRVKGASDDARRTGLERLLAGEGPRAAPGERVGLIANPTAVDVRARATPSICLLAARPRAGRAVRPRARPARRRPVHGGGRRRVATTRRTGLPVHSLYGHDAASLSPTPAMLAGLDVAASSTSRTSARATTPTSGRWCWRCARARRAGVEVVVLDRPNPIGGELVEGGAIEPGFESFVGLVPCPNRHGLTVGEMARMSLRRGAARRRADRGRDAGLAPRPCRYERHRAALGAAVAQHADRRHRAGLSRACACSRAPSSARGAAPRGRSSWPARRSSTATPWPRRSPRAALPGVRFRPPVVHARRSRSTPAQACGGVQIHVTDRARLPAVPDRRRVPARGPLALARRVRLARRAPTSSSTRSRRSISCADRARCARGSTGARAWPSWPPPGPRPRRDFRAPARGLAALCLTALRPTRAWRCSAAASTRRTSPTRWRALVVLETEPVDALWMIADLPPRVRQGAGAVRRPRRDVPARRGAARRPRVSVSEVERELGRAQSRTFDTVDRARRAATRALRSAWSSATTSWPSATRGTAGTTSVALAPPIVRRPRRAHPRARCRRRPAPDRAAGDVLDRGPRAAGPRRDRGASGAARGDGLYRGARALPLTSRTPNVFVVGAGPVATALAGALRLGGVPVLGLWARNPARARARPGRSPAWPRSRRRRPTSCSRPTWSCSRCATPPSPRSPGCWWRPASSTATTRCSTAPASISAAEALAPVSRRGRRRRP